MEKIELNIFDLNDFFSQLELASENHIYFSRFVGDYEKFCQNDQSGNVDNNLSLFRKIWFELEIINALALDDWESEGKPENWLSEWEIKYKSDAQNVIGELRDMLEKF